MDTDIARLKWRCRRGMRELDLVTTRWLDTHYADAAPTLRAAFERLLELPDPELFAYLTGRAVSPDDEIAELVNAMRSARND